MADKAALVQQVKDWQRQGDGYKQSWYNWISKRDSSGTFDPNRHDSSLLEEFLMAAHSGELDVSSSGPSPSSGKGWGGGKGKGWGGDNSWGGGWGSGSSDWGCGKGGGKWGGGMNPWDMMGMMQQMWQWASAKGLGKGDSGKKERTTELGGSTKPGDWVCPSCQNVNFSHRDTCNKCGANGRGEQRLGMKPGDWICPGCGDLVFASKSQCKMCQTPKPEGLDDGGAGGCGGGGGGCGGYGKSNNQQRMKPGDWICPNPVCGDLVFASRSQCKMCGMAKPMDDGWGGRYSPY